jgi:hypothetical protein
MPDVSFSVGVSSYKSNQSNSFTFGFRPSQTSTTPHAAAAASEEVDYGPQREQDDGSTGSFIDQLNRLQQEGHSDIVEGEAVLAGVDGTGDYPMANPPSGLLNKRTLQSERVPDAARGRGRKADGK